MISRQFILLCLLMVLALPLLSAAHFITGYVSDAGDGTPADGNEIVLWNPAQGQLDNITDIIGPSGNSGASNIYLLDCELLSVPCEVGDVLRLQIMNNGSGYGSDSVEVSVTGVGFDVAPNISMGSPPSFSEINLDDSQSLPVLEIDLTPLSTTQVSCYGVVQDYDGNATLANVNAELFHNQASFYGNASDNNFHYQNTSCSLNKGYGDGLEAAFNCTFSVEYYAMPGLWNCSALVYDNSSISTLASNTSTLNTLLALSVTSPVDYGNIDATALSEEFIINVTNAGNAAFNLSLSGYARTEGDGYAMNCTNEHNISIEHQKYNLTVAQPGSFTLADTFGNYTNLTSTPSIRSFNLDSRQNDLFQGVDDTNQTYWRINVPSGVTGDCSGNVIFGATNSPGV